MTPEEFNQLLAEHLEKYTPFLGRKELYPHMAAAIKGRLSDLERKSNEPIALAFEGPAEVRNLSNFMTRSPFDDAGMLKVCQKELGSILFHPEGMIAGEEYDFLKKGSNSVGIARQYCGRLGKKENCQVSVMTGFAGPEGYGILDCGLFMPEIWFEDARSILREKCRVPQDLEFASKSQILSKMITKTVSSGIFRGKYAGIGLSFGGDQTLLDSLPENLIYYAEVPGSYLLFPGRPGRTASNGRRLGRIPAGGLSVNPQKVQDMAADSNVPWDQAVPFLGTEFPAIAADKCLKAAEVRNGIPGRGIWLHAKKLKDGSIKYALCSESMDASPGLIRIPALMRGLIEQCLKECKEYLGLEHYEVRTWPAWRRHMLFTLIAHLFLVKLRRRAGLRPNFPGPAPLEF
ncbi:MAG: transposase [Deltaproteobacteria bacterium]|nr:transposase [Deltaproteobacteria bacterium]